MLLFCSCFTRVLSSSRTGRYLTQRFRPQCFPKWRLTLAPCDKHISRRVALHSMVVVTAFLFSSPVQSRIDGPELRGLDAPVDEQPPPFLNIGKGLSAQEVATGTGTRCVEDGSTVSVKYVMRRSNGYFIDASYGFDRFETYNFRAGSTQVVEGFDIALHGMRVGGRRRFILPPQLGYMKGTGKNDPGPIPPDFGARRSLAAHAKEPLIFEVQVVRIRPPSVVVFGFRKEKQYLPEGSALYCQMLALTSSLPKMSQATKIPPGKGATFPQSSGWFYAGTRILYMPWYIMPSVSCIPTVATPIVAISVAGH